MNKFYLTSVFIFFQCILLCQLPGDTIRVKVLDFDTRTRDTAVVFPDGNTNYEKILLKYTMRCKDGLVSNTTNRNLGCGEWDFSCNTYLVDSNKVEASMSTIPSHFITEFDGTTFPYKETPVYDYMRGTQIDMQITGTNSETAAAIGAGSDILNHVLSTNNAAGKSQYLYTADELSSFGISAGMLHGLSMHIINDAGEAKFLKIRIKQTSKTVLNGLVDQDDFTEVYYNNSTFVANTDHRFQFHTPFVWDGSSNVLVEFSFTNIDTPLSATSVEGGTAITPMGLSAINEKELILANRTYIQADEYTGISGSQNRTIEAWVKTANGGNGEIFAWGVATTGSKYVLRFTNGLLRMEVHGGGTVGSTRVDDGEWHHIACVLDGDNLTDVSFYVDGVLDPNSVTGTTAISTNANNTKLRISRGLNNRYFDANIDEMRIWDTNLSQETINEWKNLKVTSTHPNYSNLQLYYEFNGEGNKVIDSSPNGRDATIIGDRYSLSEISGPQLYRDFVLTSERPNITFYQGDYMTTRSETEVDRPIAKSLRHLVIARTIVPTDPNFAVDDDILIEGPTEYWEPLEIIFDENTGDYITENDLTPDGEINITDLQYIRRFPFYNELVSFVTPYGINLDLGPEGVSWYLDMSDYVSILKGNKRIQMTLGGQNQEEMDLEFLFIVGTPPRDVVQYEQVWQGTNRIGIANISQIVNDEKFAATDIEIAPEAIDVKIRSSVTGHGSDGEFQQNGGIVNHMLRLDQVERFNWRINKECSFNPIFPQGGTWLTDRQGWCPGERTMIEEHDLNPYVTAGGTVNIDYLTSNAQDPSGDYRYHVAHQLVAYGDANFQTDAAVVGVIAPNNSAEYTRVGTICANPQVLIKNTGAEELTSLTIKYWINDSQSPQTYKWTGNLSFMEEEVVTISSPTELWYDLLSDNNKFYAEVSSPNGVADQYAHNNTFRADFNYPEILPSDISIEFRTNNVPIENSYQLVDSDGNVIGSNNLSTANTTFTDDYNLSDACYSLLVTDLGGDGVEWWANPNQGIGYIVVRDKDGGLIKTFEPDFGGGFGYSFSTSFPVSLDDLEFLTSLKVFPNPTADFCTLTGEDLLEANIHIVNNVGQSLATSIKSRSSESIALDVSRYDAGIYFIVIQKDKIKTSRKLIIK